MIDVSTDVATIFREAIGIEVPRADVDLIETGLLDSLGLVTLVFEIEQRCEVSIPFERVEIDDFRTVSSIVRLVEAQHARPGL